MLHPRVLCRDRKVERILSEVIQIIQLTVSGLVIPALAYVIKLEKRITRLETKIEFLCNELTHKGGDKK